MILILLSKEDFVYIKLLTISIFYAIFHLYKVFVFTFCVFLYITMCNRALNQMPVNEVRDFIFEIYHKRIECFK